MHKKIYILVKQPPLTALPPPSGSAPFGDGKKKNWFLKLPQGHEDSEYVFSFEIGQQEGLFYTARTDTQTDGQNHPVAHQYIDKHTYKSYT